MSLSDFYLLHNNSRGTGNHSNYYINYTRIFLHLLLLFYRSSIYAAGDYFCYHSDPRILGRQNIEITLKFTVYAQPMQVNSIFQILQAKRHIEVFIHIGNADVYFVRIDVLYTHTHPILYFFYIQLCTTQKKKLRKIMQITHFIAN